jgi:hypothetical protein
MFVWVPLNEATREQSHYFVAVYIPAGIFYKNDFVCPERFSRISFKSISQEQLDSILSAYEFYQTYVS